MIIVIIIKPSVWKSHYFTYFSQLVTQTFPIIHIFWLCANKTSEWMTEFFCSHSNGFTPLLQLLRSGSAFKGTYAKGDLI